MKANDKAGFIVCWRGFCVTFGQWHGCGPQKVCRKQNHRLGWTAVTVKWNFNASI